MLSDSDKTDSELYSDIRLGVFQTQPETSGTPTSTPWGLRQISDFGISMEYPWDNFKKNDIPGVDTGYPNRKKMYLGIIKLGYPCYHFQIFCHLINIQHFVILNSRQITVLGISLNN